MINLGSIYIDPFKYFYLTGKPNQLSSLDDGSSATGYNDLENGTHSFIYDKKGQKMQRTNADGSVHNYHYNVYGKVEEIEDNATSNIIAKYFYDDKGFRIKKDDYAQNTETWYVRDASGNILSVYTADNGGAIEQTELPVYGSGRIGVNLKNEAVEYEITDHLGNVRVTFGENTSGNLQLNTYADYYPFGMKMAGRTSGAGTYRFGYQGQFAEDETEETGYNAFEARLWDSRIARWTTIDPAGQFYSPYLGMGNNPINGVDPDGMFWEELGNYLKYGMWVSDAGIEFYANTPSAEYIGKNAFSYDFYGEAAAIAFRPVDDLYFNPVSITFGSQSLINYVGKGNERGIMIDYKGISWITIDKKPDERYWLNGPANSAGFNITYYKPMDDIRIDKFTIEGAGTENGAGVGILNISKGTSYDNHSGITFLKTYSIGVAIDGLQIERARWITNTKIHKNYLIEW